MFLSGCEQRMSNVVGYDKTLDTPVKESCFNSVFDEFQETTRYNISLPTIVQANGELRYYEIRIDGSQFNENTSTFASIAHSLSVDFSNELTNLCNV